MKLRIYSIYLFAACVIFSSCKKELDLKPTDTFNENNAFLTIDDVQKGTNAVYARFGTYANKMYTSALVSDEAKIGADNQGQGALTYRFQYSSDATTGGDVTPAFAGYYRVIDQINRVLPYVNTVTAANPSEEARRPILRAQLLAMRGLAHFEVMQMYSKNYNATDPLGVPIMLKSDVLARPARNTMGEVITQVEADLSEAKGLLANATFSDTVMNKVNIAAYQARIALYKGDYPSAITYSTEVINSAVKPLSSIATYPNIWTDANTNEILFRIRYAEDGAIGSLWTTSTNLIYIAPSDKLLSKFTPDDVRTSAFFGIMNGNPFVNKFYTSGKGARILDIKVIRTAEMYLIRAEANAKKSGPDINAAAADLNQVRANRINGYTNETFTSAAQVITAILDERFKEFCFEGQRLFDLKRNNLPVERSSSDANQAWQTLPAGNFRFVLPIPRSEINANPNMVQNDNY